MTSLDFSKALSVPAFLISSTNRELKILTPFGTSAVLMNSKTPFLSKPFISLRRDSVNDGEVHSRVVVLGFVGLSLMNIDTSAMFYWDFVGDRRVRFDLRRGAVVVGSLVNSSVGSLDSSSSSSSLGSSGSGYRYSFTAVVLKSVGPLGSCILYISPSIPSSLNGPVHLPLCPVLPSRHTSTSELRGRSWIVVTDRPFRWFSASSTCFFALILAISSIAFFIAAARCVIEGAGGSISLIQG